MRYGDTTIEGVLFDMDGTLIDSTPAVERAWTAVALRHDLDVPGVLAICHGVPTVETLRRILPDVPESVIADELQRHLDQECTDLDGVVPLPGAHDLLAYLDAHRVPWIVVTSAVPRLALARMGAAGIVAPALVSYDDVTHGKPDPEGFLLGASRLGLTPERCLAVEDSGAGLAAARASGAIVVDVSPGHSSLVEILDALGA